MLLQSYKNVLAGDRLFVNLYCSENRSVMARLMIHYTQMACIKRSKCDSVIRSTCRDFYKYTLVLNLFLTANRIARMIESVL